jgi:hypothetical protein
MARLIPIWALIGLLFLAWASPARAQEPTCVNGYYTVSLSNFDTALSPFQNVAYTTWSADYGGTAKMMPPINEVGKFEITGSTLQSLLSATRPITANGILLGSGALRTDGYIGYNIEFWYTSTLYRDTGGINNNTGSWTEAFSGFAWPNTTGLSNYTVNKIVFIAGVYNRYPTIWWDSIAIKIPCGNVVFDEEPPILACNTVQNSSFETAEHWLLAGPAAIADGKLTLSPEDFETGLAGQAAQAVTLERNTVYSAVISVTNVIDGAVDLIVGLGEVSENDPLAHLTISAPGVYTATLTTPDVDGPYYYWLANNSLLDTSDIEIDFTCLSLGGNYCPTVDNAFFTTSVPWDEDTTWERFSPETTIENGVLNLPSHNLAQQQLTLQNNTAYTVQLNVASAVSGLNGPVNLNVSLGDKNFVLENLTAAGVYSGTLVAGDNATAGTNFSLWNYGGGAAAIDSVCLVPGGDGECTTVANPSFDLEQDWAVTYGSTITNSTLVLIEGAAAAQNVPVPAGQWKVVIDVDSVTAGPVDLTIDLGNNTETIPVSTPGRYETTMVLPPNIVGPFTYRLKNTSNVPDRDPVIAIDYTCIYHGSAGYGACLAPTNGEFNSNQGWEWFRGAAWQETAKRALLPAATYGLVQVPAGSDFTLPAVNTGEYLILGFDAASAGNSNSGLWARVWDRTDQSELVVSSEIYKTPYEFQFPLNTLAGRTVSLAFVNPGPQGQPLSTTQDAVLDNVCVFLSDQPPAMPAPVDWDTLNNPIDIGFNFTSCGDIDRIWAGFGVNMLQYRADYAAGFSFWEPTQWLVSAIFVTLADLSCFLMAIFQGIANFIEKILNDLQNYYNWFSRLFVAMLAWFLQVFSALGAWFSSLWGWLGQLWATFTGWVAASWNNFWAWLAVTWQGWQDWFWEGWAWLKIWVNATIDEIIAWFKNYFSVLYEIYDFLVSAVTLVFLLVNWLWANFISVGRLPFQFYNGFNMGFNSTPYNPLVTCSGTTFWCIFLAGVQLINQTTSQTIFYPIVIVLIILGTLYILWRDIRKLFTTSS